MAIVQRATCHSVSLTLFTGQATLARAATSFTPTTCLSSMPSAQRFLPKAPRPGSWLHSNAPGATGSCSQSLETTLGSQWFHWKGKELGNRSPWSLKGAPFPSPLVRHGEQVTPIGIPCLVWGITSREGFRNNGAGESRMRGAAGTQAS